MDHLRVITLIKKEKEKKDMTSHPNLSQTPSKNDHLILIPKNNTTKEVHPTESNSITQKHKQITKQNPPKKEVFLNFPFTNNTTTEITTNSNKHR